MGKCLHPDGLFYDEHSLQTINETTFKYWWCKKYFKEVDVNGNLIISEGEDN